MYGTMHSSGFTRFAICSKWILTFLSEQCGPCSDWMFQLVTNEYGAFLHGTAHMRIPEGG